MIQRTVSIGVWSLRSPWRVVGQRKWISQTNSHEQVSLTSTLELVYGTLLNLLVQLEPHRLPGFPRFARTPVEPPDVEGSLARGVAGTFQDELHEPRVRVRGEG